MNYKTSIVELLIILKCENVGGIKFYVKMVKDCKKSVRIFKYLNFYLIYV
jgi:hypothetical protein